MNKRNLYILVGLVIVLVVVLLITELVLYGQKTSNKSLISYDNQLIPSALLQELQIPANISNAIGAGVAYYGTQYMTTLNKPELSIDGKPEILYIGAEYCPYCAAERWALVIALSRFGSFSNLHYMTSSTSDIDPSTPTFDFYNATYTSPYISFVTVELTTNNKTTLQTPNTSEQDLASLYDPHGGIPFILFANQSVWIDADYNPEVLDGRNWSANAAMLHNTSSGDIVAQSVVGTADLITAQICIIDNNTPSSVCDQQYVKNLKSDV